MTMLKTLAWSMFRIAMRPWEAFERYVLRTPGPSYPVRWCNSRMWRLVGCDEPVSRNQAIQLDRKL